MNEKNTIGPDPFMNRQLHKYNMKLRQFRRPSMLQCSRFYFAAAAA